MAERDPLAARDIALDVWEEAQRIVKAPVSEFEREQAQSMIDYMIPRTLKTIAKISRQSGLGEYDGGRVVSMAVVIGILGLSLWGAFRQ